MSRFRPGDLVIIPYSTSFDIVTGVQVVIEKIAVLVKYTKNFQNEIYSFGPGWISLPVGETRTTFTFCGNVKKLAIQQIQKR